MFLFTLSPGGCVPSQSEARKIKEKQFRERNCDRKSLSRGFNLKSELCYLSVHVRKVSRGNLLELEFRPLCKNG